MKKESSMRKTIIFSLMVILLGFSTMAGAQEAVKNTSEYDKIIAERDNLLVQLRNTRGYKDKVQEMENSYKKALLDSEALKQSLEISKNKNMNIEQKYQQQIVSLEEKAADAEAKTAALAAEKETLKNSLERWEIEYKILPETRKVINKLEREKKDLQRSNNLMELKFKRMEDERLNQYAQNEISRRQIVDYKKRYEEALAKNRTFEKKLEQLPARFAEISRQNKVLVKETALMHYNLGVFYTKNKEYSRAIAEFEKTIELTPDDPYAHYNLGYIYAEYMVNRPKAIEQFRKFLQLCKTEDNDVDWVKKYILTWETWAGKKPMD
jgi:tetratricopeptide (TPR) repeat protein